MPEAAKATQVYGEGLVISSYDTRGIRSAGMGLPAVRFN